jgi:hypothetical protein
MRRAECLRKFPVTNPVDNENTPKKGYGHTFCPFWALNFHFFIT